MKKKVLAASFMTLIVALALASWKLTPLYQADELNERITFLGGFIQMDSREGRLLLAGRPVVFETNLKHFKGEKEIFGNQLSFRFVTSNARFHTIEGSTVKWQCEIPTKDEKIVETRQTGEHTFFDFEPARYSKCAIEFPAKASLHIQAEQGRVEIDQPVNKVSVEMNHGKVVIIQTPGVAYRFEHQLTQVELPGLKEFPENKAPDATLIQLKVSNGVLLVR